MPKLRVHNTISIDEYAAGRSQRLDAPFGDGPPLHDWDVRVPVLFGGGERLFDNLDGFAAYECVQLIGSGVVA